MKSFNDYMLLPFVDGGRDASGVDCWGLICLIYRDNLGVELPGYGEISAKDLIAIAKMTNGQVLLDSWNRTLTPKQYNVVVMTAHDQVNGRVSRVNSHFGIMIDNDKMMHIEDGIGVSIVRITSPLVSRRIVGVYEYTG